MSVREANSKPLQVCHSVPQGSVIGPILFLILINDISLLGDLVLFLDDTTILSGGDTPESAALQAANIFARAEDWFSENRLKLNANKTQEMMCTFSRTTGWGTNTTKLLGFNLDLKLSWNAHIETVCTKLARVTFLLRKLALLLAVEHLVTIYHGLFHSHLSYGLLMWGHASGCSQVLRLQKRAVRIISLSRYLDHCKPIFARLGILTVYSQYILNSLLYVKSNEHSLPTRANIHLRSLRGGDTISLPNCRLGKKRNSFPVLAMKMFNVLPLQVRHLRLEVFKFRVKTWLLRRAFYSLEEFFSSEFDTILPP
uniref:Reverse transcriptase domain-containing protein n=1 Tax=Homalodisca liturata TaxID=320908 RepID=A0A1B6JKN6_9HEMI